VSTRYSEDQLRSDPGQASALSMELSGCGADVVITIRGELERDTDHLLIELVDHVVRDHAGPVILDMAGVTFLCAHGVGALLRVRDMIAAAGGRLTLRDPSPPTRRILAITGDEQLLALAPAPAQPYGAAYKQRSHPEDRRTMSTVVR
jgi:anti-anti-sigma factor